MLNYAKDAPPLYFQVKTIIKQRIADGVYPLRSDIPSEKEFQDEFKVSRITVRKALDELFYEGYIVRQRGKGTTVIQRHFIDEELHVDKSFTMEMETQGIIPGTKYAQLREVMAGGSIAEALGLKPGEKIYELVRVRTGNAMPVVIFKNYINMAKVSITEKEVGENESLYELLGKKQKKIKIAKEVFEVLLSNDWSSKLLEIPLGSPILKRTTLVHSEGTPLLYTESLYNGYLYRHHIVY
jgi:GntR family transcriptional regulator